MFSDYKHLQVSKIEVLYTAIIPVTINARIHRLSSLILLKNDFWLWLLFFIIIIFVNADVIVIFVSADVIVIFVNADVIVIFVNADVIVIFVNADVIVMEYRSSPCIYDLAAIERKTFSVLAVLWTVKQFCICTALHCIGLIIEWILFKNKKRK